MEGGELKRKIIAMGIFLQTSFLYLYSLLESYFVIYKTIEYAQIFSFSGLQNQALCRCILSSINIAPVLTAVNKAQIKGCRIMMHYQITITELLRKIFRLILNHVFQFLLIVVGSCFLSKRILQYLPLYVPRLLLLLN